MSTNKIMAMQNLLFKYLWKVKWTVKFQQHHNVNNVNNVNNDAMELEINSVQLFLQLVYC